MRAAHSTGRGAFLRAGILVLLLAAPRFLAAADDAASKSGALARAVQPFVDDQTIAGAVMLVGTKDKILDVETVGYANIAKKIPMQPHDFFWIASMSKAMTGAAMMMLVDEGKVNLDDPVARYLPEFKDMQVSDIADPDHKKHPPVHPMTVRNILSHSSGLPFGGGPEDDPVDRFTLDHWTEIYSEGTLYWEPGSSFLYSNEGINLAGEIIQRVSGMPYEKFMQTRLFDPLGMTDTTFFPNSEQVSRIASCYQATSSKGGLREVEIRQMTYPLDKNDDRYPVPAGGIFSDAFDVAKFLQMFINKGMVNGKRILSEKAVETATSKQAPKKNYGFGWNVEKDGSYGHGGADQTFMRVVPKLGLIEVIMIQLTNPYINEEMHKVLPAFQKAADTFGSGATSSKHGG